MTMQNLFGGSGIQMETTRPPFRSVFDTHHQFQNRRFRLSVFKNATKHLYRRAKENKSWTVLWQIYTSGLFGVRQDVFITSREHSLFNLWT